MGKVTSTITCYTNRLSQDAIAVIKLEAKGKTKYLVFEYDLIQLGFTAFKATSRKSRIPSIDYSQKISLSNLSSELAIAWLLSRAMESPILDESKLSSWLTKLKIKQIGWKDVKYSCYWCEEKPLEPGQMESHLTLLGNKIKNGKTMKELEDYFPPMCERCELEESTMVYYLEDLIPHLESPFYSNHTEIRRNFFQFIPEFYHAERKETAELLEILLDEIKLKRPAYDLADEYLQDLFEPRLEVSTVELAVIKDRIDSILTIISKDISDDDLELKGFHTMIRSVLCHQSLDLKEHLDDLVQLYSSMNDSEIGLYMIKLISEHSPKVVADNFDKIKDTDISSIDFRIILDNLVFQYPEIVSDYFDILLETISSIEEPDYSCAILESVIELHPKLLKNKFGKIEDILLKNEDREFSETLHFCLMVLDNVGKEKK